MAEMVNSDVGLDSTQVACTTRGDWTVRGGARISPEAALQGALKQAVWAYLGRPWPWALSLGPGLVPLIEGLEPSLRKD